VLFARVQGRRRHPWPELDSAAVTDPYLTVKTDVKRLLSAPRLSPTVSVSGHVYDIAAGLLTTTIDARHP
jgi:carbonic anhydrase